MNDHGRAGGSDPQWRSAVDSEPDRVVTLTGLAATMLQSRRLLILFAFLGAAAGVAAARLPQATFTSSASFTPQGDGQSGMGNLSGLAGQFGIQVPRSSVSQSPEFYEELMRTRTFLSPILLDTYGTGTDVASLLDLSKVGGATQAERLDLVLEWFRGAVFSSSVSTSTGVVSIGVKTNWPRVSQAIAERLLQGIREYNLSSHQTQARVERQFLQTRVEDAREELHSAEAELQTFLEQNRQFENSSVLRFQHDRLERQVLARQEVFNGLVQAYEQARIQEVRKTPVITVLDSPDLPARRDARNTVLKAFLGLITGGMLGTMIALARAGTGDVTDPDAQALLTAWSETKRDWIVLRRGRSRGG